MKVMNSHYSLKNSFYLTLSLFFVSCTPSKLDPTEYVSWVDNPENGLVKEYQQGDLILSAQYTPNAYTVIKQYEPNEINESEIRENIDALNDLYQFKLKFQKENSGNFLRDNYTSQNEYNTKTMYISFDMRYDLKLVEGTDTVSCNMNHHERTYGNTPYETVLISFPRSSKKIQDLELIFDDRVFGFGRVKFHYSKDILSSIPELYLIKSKSD